MLSATALALGSMLASCGDTPRLPAPSYAILNQDFYGGVETTWKPEASDVETALRIAQDCLERAEGITANDREHILPEFGNFVVQVLGVGNKKRSIHLNFLHPRSLAEFLEDANSWTEQYVYVADGGPDFWYATVDLAAKTCVELSVNSQP